MNEHMIIYVSGPTDGMPDGNRRAFSEAEQYLHEMFPKAEIINPAYNFGRYEMSYSEYIRRAAQQMSISTHIYMLDGWKASPGAIWEMRTAELMNLYCDCESTRETYLRETIPEVITNVFGTDVHTMLGEGRSEPEVTARQVYMYILYNKENLTLKGVLKYVPCKEHTNVSFACRAVTQKLAKSTALQSKMNAILPELDTAREQTKSVNWKLLTK